MLKLSEVKALVKLVGDTQISELEISDDKNKIRIKKENTGQGADGPAGLRMFSNPSSTPQTASSIQEKPAPQTEPSMGEEAPLVPINSPIVGTFYESSTPGGDPFVKEGDSISKGTVVCIIEAMKIMNEIESEVDGIIVKTVVANGHPVEYGQPLFMTKLN